MMKHRRKIGAVFIAFSLLLLLSGILWTSHILPYFTPEREEGSDDLSEFGDGVNIMEGRISLPSIAFDDSNDLDTAGFRPEFLDPMWKDIKIRSDGIFDADTGEFLFESDDASFERNGTFFPSGGVGKKDYSIYNDYLGRDVTARFEGSYDVLGKKGYSYVVDIEREETHGNDLLSTFIPVDEEEGTGNEDLSSFLEDFGIRFFYSDSSRYILDPRTSIPLDLEINIAVDMKLPDTTILTVREEDVRYAEEDIWIDSTTVPGTKEKVEVIKETWTLGRLDPDDDNIGVYERFDVYYDKETGEKVSSDEYENRETFAVDRSTYQYLTGYRGTLRSGYFEFPINKVEERDYPMWDEFTASESEARFIGNEVRNGLDVMVFQMVTEDVQVDSGNAIIPIYPHPATIYLLDTVQEWYIDERTGFMVDFHGSAGGKMENLRNLGEHHRYRRKPK
ncbi:MAG: porin PorA family protein [Thermoplasmatota archaeon]